MRERLNNKYVKASITLFITGAALIVFHAIVSNLNGFSDTIALINGILAPFIYGFVLAYLLSPIYNLSVRKVYHWTDERWKTKKRALAFARVVATIISLVILIGIVGGLLWLVIPELIKSVVGIIDVLPQRLNDLVNWVETSVASVKYPTATRTLESIVDNISDTFNRWAKNEFLPSIGTYMSQISQGVIVTLKTILNIVLGLIVCVYILNSKERFKGQCKKIVLATSNRERTDAIMEFTYFTNRTFGGFINGKIIDSVIMGILCFIVMSVLGMPYTMLVSVIVGVTNFIPFFGPFIGAIPSAIIILLISPLQALYFLLMILVLQQLDGNVIGPKILGETTGLASFWVLFAIVVGGGLFGFIGMIVGVPAFAVIYYYISKWITKKLKQKKLPSETDEYVDFNQYDINRRDVL